MAIYDNNPLVVVEDRLIETMSFCKSILDRQEFGTGLHKLKWVALSNLSAFSADRLDAFGTIFYICDRIDSEDDYRMCCDNLYRPKDADTVLLFCKQRRQVFSNPPTAGDRFYSVGILCEEETDDEPLSEKQAMVVRCLKLLLMTVTLLSLESPSLKHEPIEVALTPNSKTLFCAVLCKLYDFRSEKREKEQLIEQKRNEIRHLEQTKPKVYTCNNFTATPKELTFRPSGTKDARKLYQELTAFYSQCDDAADKAVRQDIGAVRYAMAAIDWYTKGGDEPTCVTGRLPGADNPLPDEQDLLRRCPETEDLSVDIHNALQASRRFLNMEKPSLKAFVIATLCGIGGFLLSVIGVYAVRAAQTNDFWTSMKDALPMMWIPLLLLVLAGCVGAVLCMRHYNKLTAFLKEIAHAMVAYTEALNRKTREIRRYLNDFITVFYNCHSRDYRLKTLRKNIEDLEAEIKRMLSSMTPYNELADYLKGCDRAEKAEQAQKEADEEYLQSEDERLYLDSFDSEDAFVPSAPVSDAETRVKKPCECVVSCKDAKECVEYIRSEGSTTASGPDCEPFEHKTNPFLSEIRFV